MNSSNILRNILKLKKYQL